MPVSLAHLELGTLDAQPRRPVSKGVRRKTVKGRKDRAESKVKKDVRAACVDRDGGCRIVGFYWFEATGWKRDVALPLDERGACEGELQWCHMRARQRSKTRGMAPEVRHDTRYSFIACQRHHDQYDGRQRPRLFVTALTSKGANGPLKFRRGK